MYLLSTVFVAVMNINVLYKVTSADFSFCTRIINHFLGTNETLECLSLLLSPTHNYYKGNNPKEDLKIGHMVLTPCDSDPLARTDQFKNGISAQDANLWDSWWPMEVTRRRVKLSVLQLKQKRREGK